jgi:hypothetical protein
MNVSLVPIPSEQAAASCTNCGAALLADQRYCLSCGQACSPTRLAFLDVLQDGAASASAPPPGWAASDTLALTPAGYVPAQESGANGWLRRNSGLMSLLGVLIGCLLVGLLVGHWVSQSQGTRAPGKQVVEVRGLSGLSGAAAGASTTGSAGGVETPAASKASAKEEAQAAKEAAKETKAEKAPPPAPVKVTPAKLKKLSTTTGKRHQEEVNALGAQPIETG